MKIDLHIIQVGLLYIFLNHNLNNTFCIHIRLSQIDTFNFDKHATDALDNCLILINDCQN